MLAPLLRQSWSYNLSWAERGDGAGQGRRGGRLASYYVTGGGQTIMRPNFPEN